MGWWLWWAPTQPPAEQYPGGSGELSKQVKATHDKALYRRVTRKYTYE